MISILLILKGIALVGYPILEYWLGKTEKTSSGSVLEVILNVGYSILKFFLGGK